MGVGGRAAFRVRTGPRAADETRQLDECRWFAVHTLLRRELIAANQLQLQGYETLLPMHWKTVRHARRFRTVRAPFFPRYLFVRMNLAQDRWRSVNGTVGVSRLVMARDLPVPVPHGVVEALMVMTDAGGVLSFSSLMQPGQRVRILVCPFADRLGELICADARDKARILLDIMGAPVTVHAEAQVLTPAE